ncbi:COX15/CtaA family protein [Alteromonas sp. RKMC-009]|uniref:COX15/CtaA family protein n=1 Tax=Alteromonas sp. RKMC-009 TaxID=2267264 RepID=UPI000C3AE334|nr:COX15/CtaA family protein [Alteromonas sp. RKMC-009]AYA66308.1 heme A synthase [Alteromonas sp. RKMC-009]MBT79795.1 cytochrome B [Alteromonadaceae bacterium]MEC7692596.1 COX15/CtaA family protein [Pseudomonadota bacterium]
MRKLVLFSLILAVVVIILGAYTRLTDAGLGCPDWPGCYGLLTVPLEDHHVEAANAAFPERPVEAAKAWNEMIHRYFAGALGLCIFTIAAIAVKQRHSGRTVRLPLLLVALVIFQAALGMWTVTLNLLPVVVMGHLLGGFTILACLFLLHLKLRESKRKPRRINSITKFALLGMAILLMQIGLGGWTSANYAALACTDFPVCEDGWASRLDFSGAFSVPYAETYEYGAHGYGERMTMHIVHRAGAVITFLYLLWLGFRLYSREVAAPVKSAALLLIGVLMIQVTLGVSNVVLSLPVIVAVAHNIVAACLLLVMVWITYQVSRYQGDPQQGGAHG